MKKNLLRQYLKYLIPTLITMTLFSTYTMVDGIFVGRGVGPDGLSAVNISQPFVTLAFGFAILISIGSLNLISHQLGRGNRERADELFSLASFMAVFFAVLIALLGFLFLDPLVEFLGAAGPMKDLVKDYLSIIIIFLPFYLTSYVFEIMIKADGRPELSTVFMVVSALTNIILDYVFIFLFGWGLRGAAIATGIAQVLPTIGYTGYFLSKKSRLNFKKFKLKAYMVKDIFSYGFPASLAELSTGFAILIFNKAIGSLYGAEGLAAFSVIAYVMTFVVNTMLAINQASQPLIGFYYGKDEPKSVLRVRGYMVMSVAIVSIMMVGAIEIWPEFFIRVFLTDTSKEFLAFASRALRIFSLAFLVLGFNITNGGYLTAVGRPRSDFFITIMRGYLVISAFVLIIENFLGRDLIWYALLGSDLVCLIISIVLVRREIGELKA